MTENEETEQRRANGAALTGFMDRLVEAAGASDRDAVDDTPSEWETKPQTEAEAEAGLDYRHPLVERVTELALALRRRAEAEGWRPKEASPEHPVAELLDATLIAGPKLAGALNGRFWPPEIDFCAHTIVRLKRARGWLEDALRAAETCREDGLIPAAPLAAWAKELETMAGETDALIAELRDRLERGTD